MTLDELMATISGRSIEKVAEEAPVAPAAPAATSAATELEELLTKSAGVDTELNPTEEQTQMNKQAQETGKAIADALIANLVKQANAVVEDSTGMVVQQMSQQAPTPREGATVTDTLKGLLIRGVQAGGATEELDDEVGPDEAAAQGAVAGGTPTTPPAAPNGTAMGSVGEGGYASDEHEKAAAVACLVDYGVNFEDAVNLVKQAEEEMAHETIEMAKVAAVNELMGAGVDFDRAIAMIQGSARQLGL